MSVTFGLPIYVQFLSYLWFIYQNPWFLCQYIYFSTWLGPSIPSMLCSKRQHARGAQTRRESRGILVGKCFAIVCIKIYYGTPFIAPSQGPIPSPSPSPGPAGNLETELNRLCGSTTARQRLWYGHWSNQVRVKWVPCVFLPWVESKSQLRLDTPSQACHTLRGQMEKIFPLIVAVLNVLIIIFLPPTIHDLVHWIIPVSIRARISKSDVNDGVSLDFP